MKTILAMFDHIHWANERILRALANGGDTDERAVRLFSHILFAERIWVARLQGKDSSALPIWPGDETVDCEALVRSNREAYAAYLAALTEAELERTVSYRNSKGASFATSVRDILTHVALHGQYHRGQVNLLLRAGGLEPAPVDYILYVREQ